MLTNRSSPEAQIIPTVGYPDVAEAVRWLCSAFGFTERLRIGNHRAQLQYGAGAFIVTEARGASPSPAYAIHVRVEDARAHHARAAQHGATIVMPPTDFPYGERQYSARDFHGHAWVFSQSITDVDPTSWGGVVPRAQGAG